MVGVDYAGNILDSVSADSTGVATNSDKTMTEKEWKEFLDKVDLAIEDFARQVKEDVKANEEQSEKERANNRKMWLEDIKDLMEKDTLIVKQNMEKDALSDHELLVGNGLLVEEKGTKATQVMFGSDSELVDSISATKSKVPYAELEKNGVIEYNGVAFVCDEQNGATCLGDMSNPNEVLSIPLENGGSLMVNRNSIGALGQAIGMFSAQDIGRIMRAIAQDAKIHSTQKEMEDEVNDTIENLMVK